MIIDYFKMALGNIVHRKMRSWLTMIGIFIGILAVISIISLGQGLQQSMFDQFNEFGADKLWITPGGSLLTSSSTASRITERDRKEIESVPGVESTVGMAYKNMKMEFKDEQYFGLGMGYTIDDGSNLWDEVYGVGIEEGRWMDPGDTFKVVLGYNYGVDDKVFNRGVNLYDSVEIDGRDFQVIGFYEKISSPDDYNIYMIEDGYEFITGDNIQDNYMFLIAKTSPGEDPNEVAARVREELRHFRDRDEGEEDFGIESTEELMDSFGDILMIVNVVIVGIAAISLLVGGVGIMNTMYTAVVERTQEIGIMKAIGARNSDILLIFLIESGMLGLVGGAIGVALGLGLSKLIEWVGKAILDTAFLQAWWSWELIVGALAFSFFTGVISGVAPAYHASKQQAVESLRYE
ncbi:ABC transporter permease [Candidatus Woesearchaeota archaeon]|nr:ABC transporter permease [Candidatus Woesearchaeota archaeon]